VSFLLGRVTVAELTAYIDTAEQKSADVTAFIRAVQKYEHITELTPEIMHELIEKIVVHAPDKSRGHRTQEIEIHYRFNVAVTTAVADSMKYNKKERLRNRIGYATLSSNHKNFFTSTRLKVEGCFLWAVRQGKNLNVTIKNAIRGRNSQERKRWATSTRASRSEQYNEQSAKYDTSKKEANRLTRERKISLNKITAGRTFSLPW